MPSLYDAIRHDFLVLVPFLLILGSIIKYRTKVSNKKLPVILYCVAFCIAAVWGYLTSIYAGGTRWFEALILCGMIQGLIVTSAAVWGWDAFYGLWKTGLLQKKPKQLPAAQQKQAGKKKRFPLLPVRKQKKEAS